MRKVLLLLVVLTLMTLTGCASMGDGTKLEKQNEILKMMDESLNQLYKEKPHVEQFLQKSPGYGVFSNANVNVFFVAGGTGYGVVKNNNSGSYTYMNMVEGGVGLGLGAKDYRIVIVFHTEQAMEQFVNSGWKFGGNADATAMAENKGASADGEAYFGEITVYTFTESGLALQATVKGSKFWKDDELN